MLRKKVPQRTHISKPPSVCPKPHCGSNYFISHEDGWQCWNCMQIIYRYQPLPYISNNRPERVGPYNFKRALEVQEDALGDGYLVSVNLDQSDDSEPWVEECTTIINGEIWDWFPDSDELVVSRMWWKKEPAYPTL